MDILILALLLIKHWVFDFVLQTEEQIKHKGTYGNLVGMSHSLTHLVGTFLVVAMVLGFDYWTFALILATIDGILHYHIDWYVRNVDKGTAESSNKRFWFWLGLDQMLHNLVYVGLTLVVSALVL